MKVLVVEDDRDAMNILRVFLEARGHQVVEAVDGLEAIERFAVEGPDLVLLDLILPKVDGWRVLERIRSSTAVPVIIISARDSTRDVVRGLSLGGDDYIVKPFDPDEIEARIDAVMRRCRIEPGERLIRAGGIVIDDRAKMVTVSGREVRLSPKEYELLKLMASDPGKVFTDGEIIRHVWPEGTLASAGDIKRYIHLLRQKIEDDPANPVFILTTKGFGYRLSV